MYDDNFIDMSEGVIVAIETLDGKSKFNSLLGKRVEINHNDLAIAENRNEGVGFKLLDSNLALILNGIVNVEYKSPIEDIQSYVFIENEHYRYIVLEDELM